MEAINKDREDLYRETGWIIGLYDIDVSDWDKPLKESPDTYFIDQEQVFELMKHKRFLEDFIESIPDFATGKRGYWRQRAKGQKTAIVKKLNKLMRLQDEQIWSGKRVNEPIQENQFFKV